MAASFATLLHVLFLVWFLPATFSLSFFFFKAESISNVSCNEKDKQALLILKRGLTDHGYVLSSWSDHKDCCIWDGVFCDKKIGRVTELLLNYSGLGGEVSVEDDSKNSSFYIGMGVGFATGFWAICGALFFNRTWRHAYFRFADEIKDWIYVTTMIKMNLLEKLRVCLSK